MDNKNDASRKKLTGFSAGNVQSLIAEVNKRGLQKEDILTVLGYPEGWMLLFYTDKL